MWPMMDAETLLANQEAQRHQLDPKLEHKALKVLRLTREEMFQPPQILDLPLWIE